MKKPLFILITSISFFIVSCKKDEPDFSGFNKSTDSYLPYTKGSEWTMQRVYSGITDTVTAIANGETANFNGLTYYFIKNPKDPVQDAKLYYLFHDHKYLIRSTHSIPDANQEMLVLNDTVSVGGTWIVPFTENGTISGQPARLSGKLVEKNISKEVLGKTYRNVIHTTLKLQYNVGGGFQTYAIYEYYLAKGIGTIQVDVNAIGPSSSSKLINYKVK